MMLCAPLFNFWQFLVFLLFLRINYSKKYQFWLRFLQIPKTKTIDQLKIKYYQKENLIEFWKLSSSIQNFAFKSLCLFTIFTMGFGAAAYIVVYKEYNDLYNLHSSTIFYTILILNYLSLVIMCMISLPF